jgi:hypothetical protein
MKTIIHSMGLWQILVVAVVFVTGIGNAQPVRDRMLDDVVVQEAGDHVQVKISFTCYMQYVSHFPQQQGAELRIDLSPARCIAMNQDAVARRESVRPRHAQESGLVEVGYEGGLDGTGPHLMLLFERDVRFQVSQGSDYRSLVVDVQPAG